MDTRYASRKFLLALLITALTSVFFFMGRLEQALYTSTITWVFGVYVTGNVGQSFITNTLEAVIRAVAESRLKSEKE